jgi:hypothetical protein
LTILCPAENAPGYRIIPRVARLLMGAQGRRAGGQMADFISLFQRGIVIFVGTMNRLDAMLPHPS